MRLVLHAYLMSGNVVVTDVLPLLDDALRLLA